jgi:hypothetical protein
VTRTRGTELNERHEHNAGKTLMIPKAITLPKEAYRAFVMKTVFLSQYHSKCNDFVGLE